MAAKRDALGALGAAAAAVGLLVLWQVLAAPGGPEEIHVVPQPTQIVEALDEYSSTFLSDLKHTAVEAAVGFGLALVLALLLSALFVRSRSIEDSLFAVALTISSLPLIAIVPILVAWLGNGAEPKIVLAALIAFFPLLVNCTKGLKAVDRGTSELMDLLNASWTQTFLKVRVFAAVPYLVAGMRIAAPAAVLGAILGEWVSTQYGLGYRLLDALANFNPPLLWASMVVVTLVALLPFGVLNLAERLLTRSWGVKVSAVADTAGSAGHGEKLPSAARRAMQTAVGLVALLGTWQLVVMVFDLPSYLLPTPGRLASLTVERWEELAPAVRTVVRDSVGGFLLGNGLGALLAVLVSRLRRTRALLLPLAVGLQSVPIIAITPLITLVVGYGYTSTLVVTSLITFVPMFMNLTRGLASVDREALELFTLLDAPPRTVLMKLKLPAALPFVFSALRVSAPGAVSAAIIAEYIGAGEGLGSVLQLASGSHDYELVWVAVALTTALVIVSFVAVTVLERLVERRLGLQRADA